MADSLLIHGTTVALGGHAALLRGASGSGKSDLALRFIGGGWVWPPAAGERRLVADDQTLLTASEGLLIASSPVTIAGKLEVRGIGIVDAPAIAQAQLQLIVDLVDADAVDRMPDADGSADFLGHRVPLRTLAPFEISAPIKLAIMLLEATAAAR